MELFDHITHIKACAQAGGKIAAIAVPYYPTAKWCKWVMKQGDMAVVRITPRVDYLRGTKETVRGKAPFDTIIILCGVRAKDTTIHINNGVAKVDEEWLSQLEPLTYKWLPPCFPGHPEKMPWRVFLKKATQMTNERRKNVKTITLALEKVKEELPLLAPKTGRTAFETLQEHVQPGKAGEIPTYSAEKFERYRKENETTDNWDSGQCPYHKGAGHSKEDCFFSFSLARFPVKSDRMYQVVRSVLKDRQPKWVIQSWPKRKQGQSMGSYLMHTHWPEFVRRNQVYHDKIMKNKPNCAGMFDGTFAHTAQKAFVWRSIGAPTTIVAQWITGFVPRWRDAKLPEPMWAAPTKVPTERRKEVQALDQKHGDAGRITVIPREEETKFIKCAAPRFVIAQRIGINKFKLRMIANERFLNYRLPHRSFKLPTPWNVIKRLDGLLFSIDLSKAYFQIPMYWAHRPFFGGQFVGKNGRRFLFNSWPFGLSSAPYLCQLLTSMVAKFIQRVTGFQTFVFLDDFLIQVATGQEEPSKAELERRVSWVLRVFKELGLLINSKSQLFPASELLWLGRYLNTGLKRTFPSEVRLHKFCELAVDLAKLKTATVHQLQTVVGVFRDIAPKHCRILARPFDLAITNAFLDMGIASPTQEDYAHFAQMKIPFGEDAKQLLQIWACDIITSMAVNPGQIAPTEEVFLATDASEKLGGFLYLSARKGEHRFHPLAEQATQDQFKQFTKGFLALPQWMHVDVEAPKRGQPSSMIRELAAVLAAVRKILMRRKKRSGGVKFWVLTDNKGLADTFDRFKAKTPLQLQYLMDFYAFLPENVEINVKWHSREEPLAKMADQLSKVMAIFLKPELKANIRSHLQSPPLEYLQQIPLYVDPEGMCKKVTGKPAIAIVHPLLIREQADRVVQAIFQSKMKGAIITPFPISGKQYLTQFRAEKKTVSNTEFIWGSKFFVYKIDPETELENLPLRGPKPQGPRRATTAQ